MGLVDFGHVLSYEGMPDFVTPAGTQKSISFWLSARILAGLTLVYVAAMPSRPFARPGLRYALLACALLAAAGSYGLVLFRPGLLPVFFSAGEGLTHVKIATELTAVGLTLAAMLRLWRTRAEPREFDAEGVVTACFLLVLASLTLLLYVNVHDAFSLLGHAYKVAASYVLYRVVFVASVRQPYERLAVEIAEKEEALQQVRTLETFDSLTGLPNRAHLREEAALALAARRHDGMRPALLIASVDGFASITDSHGHAFGDRVLRIVADRLERLRPLGAAFRLAGDEFAFLVPDLRRAATVSTLADRLLATIGAPTVVLGRELAVSVSAGIAVAPESGGTFEDLLQNASMALHKAQEAGIGSWRLFDATMTHGVVERLNLRTGLSRALDRHELRVRYQPQFDLRSGALIGAEALVCWQHPEHGMVSASRFIQEAEESGLILPIGSWALREACCQAEAFRQRGLAIPVMAVNISAKQFQHADVLDLVRQALDESRLPASALELELTESVLIADAEAVLASVRRIKALGVHLAIDDFGTGYSSLAYLRALPIDKLKIDQSFVQDIDRRPESDALVTTIIQLARSLGMETIAEGVEDEPAAAVLRRLGCAAAQGYLFARPMAADDLVSFVGAAAVAPARVAVPTRS